MESATLGGLIKSHRLKKRLSQLEVSLRIGWSDATRLSKIEQGRVSRPSRETLNRIMDALELDDYQKGEMLKVGTRIPDKHDTKAALSRLIEEIKDVDYPVLIVDTFWTTYYTNSSFNYLWKLSDEAISYINSSHPNWMELLFLTDYIDNIEVLAGHQKNRLSEFKKYEIEQFKYEQLDYASESWFTSLIKRLNSNEEFKELWQKLPPMNEKDHLWYDYEYNKIIGSWNNKKMTFTFHVCTMRPTFDPRFNFIIHFPADAHSFELFNTTSKK